jgi:capsular exopolysaccharide synthesis family protein
MKQVSSNQSGLNVTGSVDALKIRRTLLLMFRNWYFYVVTILLFGGGAYYFLDQKFPVYSSQAFVLIEEEDNTPTQDILEGFSMRPGVQNLENQILVLQSYSIVRKAIEELPFEINVYRKGFLSQSSFYPLSPLKIEPGSKGLPNEIEFLFQYMENDRFRLSTSSKSALELDTVIPFGKEFILDQGSFTVFPVLELDDVYMTGDKIYFQFFGKEDLAETFTRRLLVENATRDGSIVRLSIEGTNRTKGLVFLDKVTEVFIENNLEKKNLEAKRIIDFIEEQVGDVQDDLILTENRLQEFRSANRIMDVSAQTQQIIDQAVVLENEKARLSLERNYYHYLDDYLSDDDDNENRPLAPAAMDIDDPNLTNLISEYSGLQAEYFSTRIGERNPFQGQLEMRISNIKQSITETLSGIMLANQMAIDNNQNSINRLNAQASNLPAKEQQLLGFEREFNLNNVLYTFLLERRAEAQIQKASNAPDHEIVDRARLAGLVSPIPGNVYAIALSLALILPTLVLLLFSSVFQNVITCEEDVNLITKLPVIAQFPHSRLNYYTIVLTDPASTISEAFRSLRNRMEFFTRDLKSPVILVSSSIPSEGKTFAATNLASVYSLAGVKTLLVGFDLRRPTLAKGFALDDKSGMTEYLIGKKNLEDILHKTNYQNLDVIPSGPIPPNPGELSGSVKAKNMFTELRRKYDCIIVDSPPVGVVSDIYNVASIADAMLLVVRHGYTRKNALSTTLSEVDSYGINGLSILINDVKLSGNSYRYTYKYKYDYKAKTPQKFNRFVPWIKS